jgi:hypothetical protein
MQLISMTTGMVDGISGRVGTEIEAETRDADVGGTAKYSGSVAGGRMSDGTVHDGIRRFSEHNVGHSEANDGRSTPHSSRLELRR